MATYLMTVRVKNVSGVLRDRPLPRDGEKQIGEMTEHLARRHAPPLARTVGPNRFETRDQRLERAGRRQ